MRKPMPELPIGLLPEPVRSAERNDCTVHALRHCLGDVYGNARHVLKEFGRRHRHGASYGTLRHMMASAAEYGFKAYTEPVHGETVAKFVEAHPSGRYFVTRRGHAFAVVDGKIEDNVDIRPRAKVLRAWRVEA